MDTAFPYARSWTLDTENYQEREAVTILPTWAPDLAGTHSYAQHGGMEIIDGCQLIRP